MKWYRSVVACATIATLAIILLATFHLHSITSTSSGAVRRYLCRNCHNSSRYVPSSARETNPTRNLLQKSALNFVTNSLFLAQKSNSSSQTVTLHSDDPQATRAQGIRAPDYCVQSNCLEHLSDSEKYKVNECVRRARTKDHYKGTIGHSDCRFLPKVGRHPVALISAPGSGNTWTRGLLEKATGICTGFIYCDTVMRANGYIGETVKSGKVLVVKTHSVFPKWRRAKNLRAKPGDAHYASAVFILRNPAKSAVAEWNRKSSEIVLGKHNYSIAHQRHTYSIPRKFFEGKEWDKFLHMYMKDWSTRLHQWVINQDKYPVHILHYEDLRQDFVEEIEKVLIFLNVAYDSDTLKSKLSEDYTEYRRPHHSDEFEHFSEKQKELVRSFMLDVNNAADRVNKSSLLRLEEYTL